MDHFFYSEFVYIVDYGDGFTFIELSLHLWDEVYLIMLNDHFYVFLDTVCKNFIKYLCIDIHKENCSEVFYLCSVISFLYGLSINVFVAS